MGKLEDRESRRRASVIGPIAGVEPETPSTKKGRPKEDRETKKRVSLAVMPSLYEDIKKIAFVQRRSASSLIAGILEQYRKEHDRELTEYESLTKGR